VGIYRENLVIAIPAYNEEKRILNTIDSLKDYGKIIVFDNNSNDLTKKYVLNHGFDLMHTLKRGYENVIFDIVKFYLNSNYDFLCIIDGDGEVGTNEISSALSVLESNHELDGILGKRTKIKRFSERSVNFFFKKFYGIEDIFCGFKILRKKGISKRLKKRTFGTSIVNKKGKFENFLVELNSRADSRLDEDWLINFKILYYGLKGLI
tara:strand:+ start:6318 stop:6941 length:624 start_codon:yes stop_codon:yes gene_type:complete